MKITPLRDRVLIRRHDEEHMSAGGIILADSAKKKSVQGTVIAVGPGKSNSAGTVLPMSVQVGDKVIFGKYAGTEVELQDLNHEGQFVLMSEEDIMAIIS